MFRRAVLKVVSGVLLSLAVFGGDARAGEDAGPAETTDAGLHPEMTTLVDDAMRKLAKSRNKEALERLARKDYPGALALLKEAYELDSENDEVANNLGYIYYLLGNEEEAERLYRETLMRDPERFTAHLNLADLLGRDGEPNIRLEEAAGLLARARELQGNKPKVILKQARVERLRGAFEAAERFYREYLSKRKPTDRLRIELGDFFRDLGRADEALTWYQQVGDGEEVGKQAAGRIWEIEVERQARQFGWTRHPETIPAKARRLASRGRILLNRGKYVEARRALEEALALAPGFSMARADLGDLFRQTDRLDKAELSYLRALAIDSSNAEIYVRLGELYLAESRNGRAAEAALFLTRALDLRPDWTSLHLTVARAFQASGDLERALGHVKTFLATVPHGKKRGEALALKRLIQKIRPPEDGKKRAVPNADGPERQPALSKELVTALGRARAHLKKGSPEAAMAELKSLPDRQRIAPVLNLEAQILSTSGHLGKARKILTRSLELEANQAGVHEQLGIIFATEERINEARKHFTESGRLGNKDAEYHLVQLEVTKKGGDLASLFRDVARIGELDENRRRLERFLSRGSTSIYLEEARALRTTLKERIWRAVVALGLICALFITTMAFFGWRVWGGANLEQLINRHPEAGPEVQRVLSAIRHEVLKHNTMVLSGLVDSMEKGEDAAVKARHLRRSLLGDDRKEKVSARLAGYAAELRKIGRSYGVRLNLRHRDRALGAIFQGFTKLERVSPFLNRLGRLSARERARVLAALKRVASLLNERGYGAVQGLLDQIRVLEVDENMLADIVERVRREPLFAERAVEPPTIESMVPLPCRVVIARRDFEDIIANLVRNGLQSSLGSGAGPIEVGLAIDRELDDITGLERAVFFVRDRSDKKLTDEMLSNREIEDGLGLTSQLISHYDGTLDVTAGGASWSKAVRVRLPMVSTAGSEDSER